jgi:hypothetical protein
VQVSGDARPIEPEPATPKAVSRSAVPVRREGLDVTVLSPDYQRIMHVLADRERSGEGPAICRQLAQTRSQAGKSTGIARHLTPLSTRKRIASTICRWQ